MIFDQTILDALEGVVSEIWEGEVWRVVIGQQNPLLANMTGARWNPRDAAALYTSLKRGTVLAELDHLRGIQTPSIRRSAYTLYRIRLRVDRMRDLRDTALLQSIGIGREELTGDDLAACREVGAAAAWLGSDAILVPSARDEGDNLVVFVNQREADAPLEVIESQEIKD